LSQPVCAVEAWYDPLKHLLHSLAVAFVEYRPTLHSPHVLAPVSLPLSVIEPAAHSLHLSSAELLVYCPGEHAVQADAPTAGPVLVMDPAWHVWQSTCPAALVNLPAAHLMHAVELVDSEASTYWPIGQLMHESETFNAK
jgi:hypothetical protein